MNKHRLRIYMTGVGGQGTLTATTLLARTVMDQGIEVVSGEIHGMAQRGGVVESTVLIGGWQSPTIFSGQADVILGFDPLETLRGLSYLADDGVVLSSTDFLPPASVNTGKASMPSIDDVTSSIAKVTSKAFYLPLQQIGLQAGNVQSGNTALLALLCKENILPFAIDALRASVQKYLPPKIQKYNLAAIDIVMAM